MLAGGEGRSPEGGSPGARTTEGRYLESGSRLQAPAFFMLGDHLVEVTDPEAFNKAHARWLRSFRMDRWGLGTVQLGVKYGVTNKFPMKIPCVDYPLFPCSEDRQTTLPTTGIL